MGRFKKASEGRGKQQAPEQQHDAERKKVNTKHRHRYTLKRKEKKKLHTHIYIIDNGDKTRIGRQIRQPGSVGAALEQRAMQRVINRGHAEEKR